MALLLACSPAGDVSATAAGEASAEDQAPAAAPSEPRIAPAFALASLSGELVRSTDLAGKTVVIDFWATWCPPCEFQVPELNAFWQAHAQDGDVAVLGISVDLEDSEVVRVWAAEKDVQYEVLVGGEELARRFGALGFPTLYVLAPDGSIEVEHVGLIETADLEAALAKLREGS